MKRRLEDMLDSFTPTDAPGPVLAQKATFLARFLQERATELQTPQEKRQQAELERMMQTPADKATVTQITDQAFRSTNPSRAVDQLTHILDLQGIPRFFSPVDRAMLRGFQSFGSYLPGVAVPLVKDKMRGETANVILPAEPDLLEPHLAARRKEGIRMNVNHLGEALLGETEAEERMRTYLHALQMPEIEVISVKISTIYSQISLLAREHTLEKLGERLELLYRAALKGTYKRNDGTVVPKFVYLDMEEYRDLAVTADVFMKTLDRPGLEKSGGGIALQAYLPDSYQIQQKITEWARARVAAGGAPVTIRIVKGANMEMERVESSIHGWEQPPYQKKVDTDANYKRMLQYGMEADNIAAVRIGVASHNLFDLSYGLLLAAERNCLDKIQFEMLEGMANHQRRALFEFAENMLLYAPATPKSGFLHAIGYLIRRLDENTGPENFLRHAFKIEVGSPEWQKLEAGFLAAFERIPNLPDAPRRTQDRQSPPIKSPLSPTVPFDNESDTDWSLPRNVDWGQEIIASWRDRCNDNAAILAIELAGEPISMDDHETGTSEDPSRPGTVVARFPVATVADAERAIACAKADPDGWGSRPHNERAEILAKVAHELRLARADLLGAALAEGGKLLTESDPEISEAIDFVEYYPRTVAELANLPNLSAVPIGPVAVIPPWNFPLAIPCGGIAAALAAGNTVLLKPAMQTILCAYKICEAFWKAGVPKTALQFVAGPGRSVGSTLAGHPDVAAVILTGGTETALKILETRPETNLLAETGGKNATIVTALSDRELAIKHVVQSAFGHSGQKCSATSLLILEDEVYNDVEFRRALCDAVKSLPVGSVWEPHTKVGPLIRPPNGPLETALKELEPGEEWAVVPHQMDHNPNLWSPAVKWGVQPDSFTHKTEFFGPVLGVMRAANLETAIDLVNRTGFGLTSGLESLDDREQAVWRDGIRAGNLYINRGTTGAIVLRQPFGGMGKSAFGPGIKAGGPNYVAQLLSFTCAPSATAKPLPPVADDLARDLLETLANSEHFDADTACRLKSFAAAAEDWLQQEFRGEHDHFQLVGQDNIRRYLPAGAMRIRVTAEDSPEDVVLRILAAYLAGCQVAVSFAPKAHTALHAELEAMTVNWGAAIEFIEETDEALAAAIAANQTDRVRYAAPDRVPAAILQAVGDTGVYVAKTPICSHPRIELLWYFREQSISFDYHRYGNLGTRADDPRRKVG